MALKQVDFLFTGIQHSSGDYLNGGLVYFYEPGTTTDRTVYTDSAGATPHPQPVVLDSRGRCLVFTDQLVKAVVKTSAGVTVTNDDNLDYVPQSPPSFAEGGDTAGQNRTLGNTDAYGLGLLTNNTTNLFLASE